MSVVGRARGLLARVPGASRAYRATLDRVRALPADHPVRRAAVRVNEKGRVQRTGPMDIRPGRYFVPGKGRTLPVVVLVATGLGPGDAERLADEVEHAQMTTAGFRPLFVVDVADFGVFRSRGYAVEHVVPEARYAEVAAHQAWSEYLVDRVGSIARSYGASAVVPLPPGQPDAVPRRLLRLIGTVPRTTAASGTRRRRRRGR